MKKIYLFFLCIVLLTSGVFAGARIVVIGSSTAFGAGPKDKNNTWVNRYISYLKLSDQSHSVINLGISAYTTYHVMPSEYTSPVGRPIPQINNNITKAISYNPHAIIINLPTNDVSQGFSLTETYNNYKTMLEQAHNAGIPVWITTSQPRNFPETEKRNKLIELRDSTYSWFGVKTIDFWNEIAASDGRISSIYDSGDGIHLNDDAHAILFQRVVDMDILNKISYEEEIEEPNTKILEFPVKIDFGGASSPFPWNNMSSPALGMVVPDLIDEQGGNSGISIEVTDAFAGINQSGPTTTTTNPVITSEVSGDSFWGNGQGVFDGRSDTLGILILKKLNKTMKYNLLIFGSRAGVTDNRETLYEVSGDKNISTTLNTSNNTSAFAEINSITPKENGTITIRVSAGNQNNNSYKFFYINSLIIQPDVTNADKTSRDLSAFNAYPNPFKDRLCIRFPENIFKIMLSDLSGRIIHEMREWDNTPSFEFDGSLIQSGSYVLTVVGVSGVGSSKLVVK